MIPQSLLWPLSWPEILPSLARRPTHYSSASTTVRPLGGSKILLICPYLSLVFWGLEFLTLTPGGLWISSFFHRKVTHVDQSSCPCKPWKEVRGCSAWQPCLGLLRADTGQSLCAFSYDVFFVSSVLNHQSSPWLLSLLWKTSWEMPCLWKALVCLQQISWRMSWVPGVMGKLQSGSGPSIGGVLSEKTHWSLSSLHWPDIASYRTSILTD